MQARRSLKCVPNLPYTMVSQKLLTHLYNDTLKMKKHNIGDIKACLMIVFLDSNKNLDFYAWFG